MTGHVCLQTIVKTILGLVLLSVMFSIFWQCAMQSIDDERLKPCSKLFAINILRARYCKQSSRKMGGGGGPLMSSILEARYLPLPAKSRSLARQLSVVSCLEMTARRSSGSGPPAGPSTPPACSGNRLDPLGMTIFWCGRYWLASGEKQVPRLRSG